MPDWSYHTFLRPVVARVPRSWLRAWGESRVGGAVVSFLGHAQADPRVGVLAGPDTRALALRLGAGFTREQGRAVADPGAAVEELRASGSVLLDLREGGPGLPKRVAEAVAPRRRGRVRVGFLLLGLGMVAAGLAAALVAATRVVLPYDEAFVDVPRELLPFLAHDRMTLAGTMVSIGVLYAGIAWRAPDAPWARSAIGISATLGFANFFLFLAYGYFDPLHAAVSAALLPLFLWGMWGRADGPDDTGVADLRNDAAWRRAQWGTLGLVALGFGLVIGGITIAVVGSTRVFVASDLVFIGGEPAAGALRSLIAHDRAGFGGALVSNGVLVMFAAMWGIRRGAAWLWWTFLGAGLVGFGATIAVHVAVGYTDAWHLAPVVFALVLFAASLAALAPYMCRRT